MSCKDVPIKCKPSPARHVSPFWGFTAFTPTIPKLYWDVKSQEQRILRICDLLDKLICYSDYLGDNVEVNRQDIEALKRDFLRFKEHGFDDFYLQQVEKWISDNLQAIFQLATKQVFLGLTLDGYFVSYIPEGNAWDDVVFDTGATYDLDTYGRLMLYYPTDSNSDVWQSDMPDNTINARVAQLEQRVARNENTLYTPITEGDL